MNKISGELSEAPKKLTVGEEFVEWAEQGWGLKRKYASPEAEGSESCPYSYVKETFINKIDTIIKDRLC
jgi:hypothetical protein